MTYVEWLRVRNALRIVGIILGIVIVAAVVTRIAVNRYVSDDTVLITHMQHDAGASVTQSVLPNGVKRTTVVDRNGSIATVDNLGNGMRHVVVREPAKTGERKYDNAIIGSISVHVSYEGNTRVTTIDTDHSVPFVYYMLFADFMALIVATMLAAPFAREGDGHLEIALLRPVSRAAFAIGTIGVDIVGIFASSLMAIVALAICQALFATPSFDFQGVNFDAVLMGIALPLAWYAMLAAATASLRRGYGAVLGFAWPVAFLVLVLGTASLGDSLVAGAIHNIFWVISRINPLTYVESPAGMDRATGELLAAPGFAVRLTIEAALFLIYSALAVLQWRRVEA